MYILRRMPLGSPSHALLTPGVKLWARDEIIASDAVPRSPGVYAWWFREIPPGVPAEGCITRNGVTLLYIGTAPKAPSASGAASQATLRSRLRQHMRGNASGSTLRLTLGCLLGRKLGIELRRVGKKERMTFCEGEQKLSQWLSTNALVSWMVTDKPWEVESSLISSVCLPLNLAHNARHPFHSQLSACRTSAKARARELPVWRPTQEPPCDDLIASLWFGYTLILAEAHRRGDRSAATSWS